MEQLCKLDKDYEGGLLGYISNAKQLLQDSRQGQPTPASASSWGQYLDVGLGMLINQCGST